MNPNVKGVDSMRSLSRRPDRVTVRSIRGNPLRLVVFAVLAAAALVGLSVSTAAASNSRTTTTTVKISTRNIKGLGPILVNSKGLTLYMFVPDKDKRVTCVATCAALWPPLFLRSHGKVTVSGKAKRSLVSSDPDKAGGRVVTDHGWPLYTYVADTKPGMTTGQALNLNGGLWYVLSPTGKVIHKKVRIKT
jgi:predicted lipoprotein with Yx(FWY)xxD motif